MDYLNHLVPILTKSSEKHKSELQLKLPNWCIIFISHLFTALFIGTFFWGGTRPNKPNKPKPKPASCYSEGVLSKIFKPQLIVTVSNFNSFRTLTRLLSNLCIYSNQLVQKRFSFTSSVQKVFKTRTFLPSLMINVDVKNHILDPTEIHILTPFQNDLPFFVLFRLL